MVPAELYQQITDKIVAQLEQGVVPWVKPWSLKNVPLDIPRNAITGRRYSGINVLMLWSMTHEKDHGSHKWLTFNQAREVGGMVRKGEKHTKVIFVKPIEREEQQDDGSKETVTIMIPKVHMVFNVSQVDNLPEKYREVETPIPTDEAFHSAMAFAQRAGAEVEYHHRRAAYVIGRDTIQMPPMGAFNEPGEFFGTLAHELVHWTGAKHRLKRDFGDRFGDELYAREELIAELGSAFMCAEHGLDPTFRSAAYLKHWIDVLKEDNRAIFATAAKASKAVEYINERALENTLDADREDLERDLSLAH